MRRNMVFALAAAAMCLAGCSLWEEDAFVIGKQGQSSEYFTLEAQSNKMLPQKVTTKASDPKDDAEKEIRQLYLFFFDSEGKYLSEYQNRFIGFQKPGEGQSTLKVDRNAIVQLVEDKDDKRVTVYAVANVEPEIFRDNNNDNIPDNFSGIKPQEQLENYVYSPKDVVLGIQRYGMPMIGSAVIDFSDNSINNEVIKMKALMSRIDVNITLDSDIEDNNLPALSLMEWRVINAPTRVSFTEPAEGKTTSLTTDKDVMSDDASKVTYNGQPIYNRNGQISLSFYMFENIQDALYPEEWTYPVGTTDVEKQRYKPLLANDVAAALELHAYYTTYNDDGTGSATYDVTYTLYLGANHTDDFKVRRNHQYKNDITIKGLTQVGNNPEHITFDARISIVEDNPFYISILRERNHDAHFCVTPMDVYLFASEEEYNPSMEVILGEVPAGSETPVQETVPDWIGMERIPAENMAVGSVPVGMENTNDATREPWYAGNGKRNYFTSSLVSGLPEKVTIENSRDRVYFYLDENRSDTDNRTATVTFIYKENGEEKRRRTMILEQVHLLPVRIVDEGRDYYIYMEQFEEYLNHYDPLDEHQTEMIYDGLPWANLNTPLANVEVPQLHDADGNDYDPPQLNIHNGYEYTGFIIDQQDQEFCTLNEPPLSAFQYCFNKNIRGNDNKVPIDYYNHESWLVWERGWRMRSNGSKWFLPGIRQMERALTQYYSTYSEFQEDYYWSASAGESFNIFGNPNGQQANKARATKAKPNGSHVESGNGDDYPNGGYADRTQELRIRAFRVDLAPYDY